jgi:very-short-patch-repair endonuclease
VTPVMTERARLRWLSKRAAFILEARAIHGDRYDYSLVEYLGLHVKVAVTCSLHGVFNPKPANHIHRRSGCPGCAGNAPMTLVSFLADARKAHGDLYDYSEVTAPRAKVPVRIACRVHGVFEQRPRDHAYSTAGCPTCGRDRTTASSKLTVEQFLERAETIHAARDYDYSRAVYVDIMTSIEIVCRTHGPFWQSPNAHLNAGQGCARCAGTAKLTRMAFVDRSRVVHGERYDYSRVVYVNSKTLVEIGCPEHGVFRQAPHHHGRGIGCPACSETHGERAVRRVLEKHCIEFEAQWTHPTLVHVRQLRSDFALSAMRVLIEFDGPQHYEAVQFGRSSRDLALTQLEATRARDQAKERWAREEGWSLIRLTDQLTVEAGLIAADVIAMVDDIKVQTTPA